ncbi:sodium/proton antiporter NhaB [Celerinatantimonas yamalensis]|uniref:Na(+)/H(+) antiporter NhaB n=1 Tax=Celerinatantimonas yamalensis TaxID=559956 RepID=A0ABW9G3B4_9GAMM
MNDTFLNALAKNFLGSSPRWYKQTILTFLVINPILFAVDPFVSGWILVIEFIFTLAMALKCYPLQPGGLLAIEAIAIGMTSTETVKHELIANFEVILLLIFMVAGIFFMKELLLFVFTKMLTHIRSKVALSLAFCGTSAFLSAFLDALTVIAVVISVAVGFYAIYHKVASGKDFHLEHDHTQDDQLRGELTHQDLEGFRAFLRSLLMHASVGTALGGVCTMVGEPQNLIIAEQAGWHFAEFFIRMAPVSIPVLILGLVMCVILEKTGWFGYGGLLPDRVRIVMEDYETYADKRRTKRDKMRLGAQLVIAAWLIVALALHLAAVGLVGLSVIILATTFSGINEEHQLGAAFTEALPFTALLAIFFSIVAVIIDLHLFKPIIHWVLEQEGHAQLVAFYLANGVLSMVSDNVFVGTVYINEVRSALMDGQITRDQFDMLAVAINTGTNLPSVATPNGQAAFLFLLTSSLAPLLRLSYGRMVFMALPYTIVLIVVGLLCVNYLLIPLTDLFYHNGLLIHHAAKAAAAAIGH